MEIERRRPINYRRPAISDRDIELAAEPKPLLGRELTEKERSELTARIFKDAFVRSTVDIQDLFPYRVRVAYRVCREIARNKGFVGPLDALTDALAPSHQCIDPWTIPMPTLYPETPGEMKDRVRHLLWIFDRAEALPDPEQQYFYDPDRKAHVPYKGLAILPPDPPGAMIGKDGSLASHYTESEDRLLGLYVEAVKAAAAHLYIMSGSREDPNQGELGLRGITDVTTIREWFPDAREIIQFEQILVDEVATRFIQDGYRKARQDLRDKYGFQKVELDALLRLVKARLKELTEADIDEDRSAMILRWEDYIERAKKALDLKSEAVGLKNLATVLGLGQQERADIMDEFVGVVKTVERQREALNAAKPPLLDHK